MLERARPRPERAAAAMVRCGRRREQDQLPGSAPELMACLLGAVESQLLYNGLSSFGSETCPATVAARRRTTPPIIFATERVTRPTAYPAD